MFVDTTMWRGVFLLCACAALVQAAATRERRADDEGDFTDLGPPSYPRPESCQARGGRLGQCVHESMCAGDLELYTDYDDEIILKRCSNNSEWCCVLGNSTSTDATELKQKNTEDKQ